MGLANSREAPQRQHLTFVRGSGATLYMRPLVTSQAIQSHSARGGSCPKSRIQKESFGFTAHASGIELRGLGALTIHGIWGGAAD